ncbi:MAG: enamine deaminase RidA [Alphaproteobacteria bacterium]|nr:enamine deaminase RidA [Alphaproteobacteria bacterium]|tara:strand:+ start:875 stop:1258 length:384 start_codon:yes stop_codon:yes gene_type:complete
MNRYFNPEDLAQPFGSYSQGVEITNASKLVYVAGQVGAMPDGTVPEDFEAQAEQAFRNVQGVLRAADMDVEHVVSMRYYLLDRENVPKFRAAKDRVFGDVRPAGTLLIVGGLASPDWHFEVDAFAYK